MALFTFIGVFVVIGVLLYLGVKMETGEGILVPEVEKERHRRDKLKQDAYHLKQEKARLLIQEYSRFFISLFKKYKRRRPDKSTYEHFFYK